jgi:hypothetical protein
MSSLRLRRASIRRIVLAAFAAVLLATVSSAPAVEAQNLRACEYENVERVVAVGDVHGAYERYVEILRTAGIIDGRRRWSGGKAHFVQLGDIVDRGPDSRKVLDLLRDLEEGARRAGGRVHVLLGNHEVMRMVGDMRYVSPGEYEAFVTNDSKEIRQRYLQTLPDEERERIGAMPLGFIEMRVAFGREGQYGRWLHRRDTVIRVNGVMFLHGGLSPEVAQLRCDTINDTVRRELTTDMEKTRAAPLQTLAAGENGPLWYRGLAAESVPKLDEILALQGATAIVVAHTVQQEGRILKRFDGKVFVVDTGMQAAYLPTGRAAALEIKDGVFTAIYTDRREVLLEKRE